MLRPFKSFGVLRGGTLAAASLVVSFAAPAASAQVTVEDDQTFSRQAPPLFLREPEHEPSALYGSTGVAWSGEWGFEIEFGIQAQVGALQLRFSPFNISVFDGDDRYDHGRHLDDDDYYYYDDDCYDDYDDTYSYAFFCYYEPDSELRSVAEAQIELAPGFSIGGGVAYQMQGEFDPDRGRASGFVTLSSRLDEESAMELRIGHDYSALRVVGFF
jgi:hypothetical protein